MTCLKSASPEQTIEIGRRLGLALQPGSVVSMEGPLGAGKTTLVKGIALALGIEDPVTSPSFTLVSSYSGSTGLHHVDLYRLEALAEIEDLGLEELMSADAVTVIEWGEKARVLLPNSAVRVRISIDGPSRSIAIEGARI
jgi:tRNA threonylcarbamoyladenosine biosynthesis protein TsaE